MGSERKRIRTVTFDALVAAAGDAGAFPELARLQAAGAILCSALLPVQPRDEESPWAAGRDADPAVRALNSVRVYTPEGAIAADRHRMDGETAGSISLAITLLVAESEARDADDWLDDIEDEVRRALGRDGAWRQEVFSHLSEAEPVQTVYDIAVQSGALAEATMLFEVAARTCWPVTIPDDPVHMQKFDHAPQTDDGDPDFVLTVGDLTP